MDELKIKNKNASKRFKEIYFAYKNDISIDNLNLIKVILLRYKKNSSNEEYLPLILIYGLLFYKVIDISNKHITLEDKNNLLTIQKTFYNDVNGNFEEYIKEMLNVDNDLFIFKMIIKYTVLNDEKKYLINIPNIENYYKSIGYIIPVLTLKDSSFLGFFQDEYFKKIYPEEYVKVKNKHLKETSKLELPGHYIINTVNGLNLEMEKSGVDGTINLRKKSYFSLYSKYNRKKDKNVTDSIGVRIIFSSLKKLNMFKKQFETDYLYIKKKDYIKSPKENGYKAIHYSYINPFRNGEILVELQIKTKEMENEIVNDTNSLSHYCYTINSNKWDPLFKEVLEGYKIMSNYLLIENKS